MRQFGFIGGLLLLAASSIGAKKSGKEDPSIIMRCMAENIKTGEEQIQACRDCFKKVESLETETGLSTAKECSKQYLKLEYEACSDKVSQLTPGDEEKGKEVLECFDQTLQLKNYERCLGLSNSATTQEKLVDGAMCALESWKWGMEYVKNATMDGRPNRKRPGHGKGKKGKMGIKDKMIVMAHCAHANKGDETRQGDCKKCFMNAVKPSRNPRARVNAKEAILTAVTGCSEEFLAPVYDKCTTMLKDKTSEKKGVHECYIRLLVTELVQTCSNGITEATPETMNTVMDCGKDKVKAFVMKNASPKMLEKIGKMFDDDDDDDEE